MVTRAQGDDWIVLQSVDRGYGIGQGHVFPWADSFCSQMVAGLGPRIAPCSSDVPAYAAAEFGNRVGIGAYAGVPLHWSNGELFGTLCAIHPSPLPHEMVDELPLIELFATMLMRHLASRSQTRRTNPCNRACRSRVVDRCVDPALQSAWLG